MSGKAKKPAKENSAPAEASPPPAPASAQPSANPPSAGTLYIDASGHIAGRLCSVVASEIIRGKRVVVLNAEQAVLSGKRETVIAAWKQRLELGSKVNPIYGPLHPRRPDNILRRMVRGMVPKQKTKGVLGMKRLRIYMGVPQKFSGVPMSRIDNALATRPLPMYTTIAELSHNIGWNG